MSAIDPDAVRARPTVRQYNPADEVYYADDVRGDGWVLFAGTMLATSTLNMIEGIAAVSNSTFFVNDAKFILSDLNTWGWVLIAVAAVQGLTALGVWTRTPGIRWVGVTIAALNAIAQMFSCRPTRACRWRCSRWESWSSTSSSYTAGARASPDAMARHRHRSSRLDDVILNAMAFAWVGRGLWRVTRGRAPWHGAPRR